MTERLIFVGQTRGDPAHFLQSANLNNPSPLPDETPKNQLLFLADRHRLSLNENGEESKPPILVIEDRTEQMLQTANAMLKDPDKTSRQAIENLSGALILVKLETKTHSVSVDKETGIRVANIAKGQYAFPVHPTPNS